MGDKKHWGEILVNYISEKKSSKPLESKWTWQSQRGEVKKWEIDYLIFWDLLMNILYNILFLQAYLQSVTDFGKTKGF